MQLSCEYDYQLRREGLTTSSAKRQVKRRSTSSQQFFKTITSQLLIKFINLLWFTSQSNLYKSIYFILLVILIWTATNVKVLKSDVALNMPIYHDRWHDCSKVDPNVLKLFELCVVCLDRTSFSVNYYMYLSVLGKRLHSVNLDMECKAGHFSEQT